MGRSGHSACLVVRDLEDGGQKVHVYIQGQHLGY
jgi:hypothetical protein